MGPPALSNLPLIVPIPLGYRVQYLTANDILGVVLRIYRDLLNLCSFGEIREWWVLETVPSQKVFRFIQPLTRP